MIRTRRPLVWAAGLWAIPGLVFAADPVPLASVSHIHGIAFDASNPGTFLLATHHGIFRVADGEMATRISPDQNDYMGFTAVPGAPGTFIASGHPEGGGNLGVLVTETAGADWRVLSLGADGPADFHAMTASPAEPMRLYGLYRGIQTSLDGGKTWAYVPSTPDAVFDLAAYFESDAHLFSATRNGLMESIDAGATWAVLGPKDIPVTLVEATADGTLYAFYAGQGLFARSANGQWSILNASFGADVLLHLAVDPRDPKHLLAVTQASEVHESVDGGANWQPLDR